jgi:hypothetical protein
MSHSQKKENAALSKTISDFDKSHKSFASQLKVLGDGDDPVFLETAVSSASRPSRRRSRSRAKQEGDLHSKQDMVDKT